MNSIVVPNEEYNTFENLFELYKKIRHLVSISEYWLCSSEGEGNLPHFINFLVEVTNYLHQDY